MKNQYVGDVNDFVKYGLLRGLTERGSRSSLIAWMLTADDDRPDGRKLAYLDEAPDWRHYDPELFDSLHHLVLGEQARSVDAIAEAKLLPNSRFHTAIVPSKREDRRQYFVDLLALANGQDLVFFDPDNGLEVDSCPIGRRNSDKYLLWNELAATYAAGHSVLVYQHFRREPREAFIARHAERIAEVTGSGDVLAFRTAHVAFFLSPQRDSAQYYSERAEAIGRQWGGRISSVVVRRAVGPFNPEAKSRAVGAEVL